jgi:histone H3
MPRTKVTAKKLVGGTTNRKPGGKPPQGKVNKPRRFRPGTVSLRQIRKYQTSTNMLIPKLSFQRFVKELMQMECYDRNINSKKIQSTALLALQCAAEDYVIELFQQSQIAAFHGKRLTVIPDDIQLVLKFRGDELKFNRSAEYNNSFNDELCRELYVKTNPSQHKVTYHGRDPNHIQK